MIRASELEARQGHDDFVCSNAFTSLPSWVERRTDCQSIILSPIHREGEVVSCSFFNVYRRIRSRIAKTRGPTRTRPRGIHHSVEETRARNNLAIGVPIEYVTSRPSLPFIVGAPPHARLVALLCRRPKTPCQFEVRNFVQASVM
jgi:hypothetical protein